MIFLPFFPAMEAGSGTVVLCMLYLESLSHCYILFFLSSGYHHLFVLMFYLSHIVAYTYTYCSRLDIHPRSECTAECARRDRGRQAGAVRFRRHPHEARA